VGVYTWWVRTFMYVTTMCTYPQIVNIHRFGPSDSRSRPGSRGSESGHEDQKREIEEKKREKFGRKLSPSLAVRATAVKGPGQPGWVTVLCQHTTVAADIHKVQDTCSRYIRCKILASSLVDTCFRVESGGPPPGPTRIRV
jgi:hypothetical protein